MNKNILIVCRSFYPLNTPRSLRATELAKEFARQGHQVTVITPKTQGVHDDFEKEHGVIIKDMGTPRWKYPDFGKSKVGYILSRMCVRFLGLAFEFPDIELMFKTKKALRKEKGYDLLISIAVPHPIHWGVAAVRNDSNRIADTWVADCGDPYMLATSDTFKKVFYFKYFEKAFCRKADYVTVPIERAREAYYPEFSDKIKVIPQGFNFPEKEKTSPSTNEIVTFVYSGTIGPYRHYALPFFKMLNECKEPFLFKIYTKEKEFFKKYMSPETLSRCAFYDYIPREELISELNRADFLLYFPYLRPQQKPLKLIDYHFTGRPILEFKDDSYSREAFSEFISRAYHKRIPGEEIEPYRIENVCKAFLQLSEPEKQIRFKPKSIGTPA